MTFQEPIQDNKTDAQGVFMSATGNKSQMIIDAEKERQNRQDIAVRNITERKYSRLIAQSNTPLIIITEDKAESCGALYKRLNDVLLNMPVVFENQIAQQKFERSQFCMMNEFNHRTVGYLVRSDDFEPKGFCSEIKKSDCVIVFGNPQKDLSKALKGHGRYIMNDKVNLSLVETLDRNQDAWTSWNKCIKQASPRVF